MVDFPNKYSGRLVYLCLRRLVSRVKTRGHRKYLIGFFVRGCYRHRGRDGQGTILQRAISLPRLGVPPAQLYLHGGTILGKDNDTVAVKRFTYPADDQQDETRSSLP